MSFQESSATLRSKLHLGKVKPAALMGVLLLAVAISIGVAVGIGRLFDPTALEVVKNVSSQAEIEEGAISQDDSSIAQGVPQVCVHVSGCVVAPGLVMLNEGERVAQAIAQAGGFSEDAAQDSINQARVVVDGEQIIVPSKKEIEAAQAAGGTTAGQASLATGKVNINTADANQLMTLDGVGESTAGKIIKERESNGPFKTIEDIKRVSGIGDKKFEALKDSISVG